MVTNTAMVVNDFRDLRSQVAAIMALMYEMAHPSAHHTKESMTLVKTYMGTIVRASRAKIDALPEWFLPKHKVVIEAKPFASGSFGSVYNGV